MPLTGTMQSAVAVLQAIMDRGVAFRPAVDGGYAARPFLKLVLALGIVVVSRLRKDTCICSSEDTRRTLMYPVVTTKQTFEFTSK